MAPQVIDDDLFCRYSICMTDFLYARPSFLEGASRVLDLFGVLQVYNSSQTIQEADQKAIMTDWLAIGKDFQNAIVSSVDERKAK